MWLLLVKDSPADDTSLPKIDNLNGNLHRQNCNHLMYILLLIIEYTKKLFDMTFNYVYNLKIPEEIEDHSSLLLLQKSYWQQNISRFL
jgi:hypothetical protein